MEKIVRAYSLIEVKSLNAEKRTFSGRATTPDVDRAGDTINPLGAKFANPLVLLHQHDSDRPIGSVTFKKPTKDGIPFDAEIPVIKEPGPLKDRVDTAWGEIVAGLVRGVSIGFRPTKYAFRDDGGIDFQEIEIIELSCVSVPANAAALITSVGKNMDAATMATIKSFDTLAKRSARPSERGVVHLAAPAATAKKGRVVTLAPSTRSRQPAVSGSIRLTDREKREIGFLKETDASRRRRAARGEEESVVVRLTADDLRRARRGR